MGHMGQYGTYLDLRKFIRLLHVKRINVILLNVFLVDVLVLWMDRARNIVSSKKLMCHGRLKPIQG